MWYIDDHVLNETRNATGTTGANMELLYSQGIVIGLLDDTSSRSSLRSDSSSEILDIARLVSLTVTSLCNLKSVTFSDYWLLDPRSLC